MTLVILAAGMGSRYGGMKQIDPMGPCGEFIIDYSCYDAIRAGVGKIVFVIKEENYDAFRETVGRRVEPFVKVEYAFQKMTDITAGFTVPEGRKKPWGTAHALMAARHCVDDNFITINADDFYGADTFRIICDYMNSADSASVPIPCCIAGFRLCNTLTDNGTVSRGICEVTGDGFLSSITERVRIQPRGEAAEYEENGTWYPLTADSVTSINCFGLAPALFGFLEEEFAKFLSGMKNPEKDEFYLPYAVTAAREAGLISVKVCNTKEKWYGVTYHEDKADVKANITGLIGAGVYKADLWEGIRK